MCHSQCAFVPHYVWVLDISEIVKIHGSRKLKIEQPNLIFNLQTRDFFRNYRSQPPM